MYVLGEVDGDLVNGDYEVGGDDCAEHPVSVAEFREKVAEMIERLETIQANLDEWEETIKVTPKA